MKKTKILLQIGQKIKYDTNLQIKQKIKYDRNLWQKK